MKWNGPHLFICFTCVSVWLGVLFYFFFLKKNQNTFRDHAFAQHSLEIYWCNRVSRWFQKFESIFYFVVSLLSLSLPLQIKSFSYYKRGMLTNEKSTLREKMDTYFWHVFLFRSFSFLGYLHSFFFSLSSLHFSTLYVSKLFGVQC